MDITLRDLIERFFKDCEELSPAPTPGRLKEEKPMMVSPDGSARLYRNGYVLYSNETARCVIWLPGCRGYSYRSVSGKATSIPEEILGGLPWYIAVTLFGEDASAENSLRRKGDRPGARTEIRGARDEHDAEKAYRWRSGGGESPEVRILRKAQIKSMLDALTPLQKQVLILYEVYGYSQTEIAEKKKVSVSSISKTLLQARRKLKFRKVPF